MQYDAHQTHNNEFTMSIYIFFYSYLIYPIHQTTEKEEKKKKKWYDRKKNDMRETLWENRKKDGKRNMEKDLIT